MDPAFRRASVYFDDIEYQRRFEQNLIRYDLKGGTQITKEITVAVSGGGGGGGGGGQADCYWTLEGSNIVRYGGNVGVGVHPHLNDFEVRGNVLVEAIAEQSYVEIRNWSDTAYDPVIHWSVGATPVKKFTMGVDDSDADAWLLCSGDILTSVVAAEEYGLSINYDGTLLVVDTENNRIKRHLSSDAMTFVSKIGSLGSGDDQFYAPWGICTDGWYVYVLDSSNHRVVKRLLSDLSYVAKIGSLGTGDDQFNVPRGFCTDGTHLYIADGGNNRIVKRLCSDLSFVAKTDGSEGLNGPRSICTDGNYLYLFRYAGATWLRFKFLCSTLGLVQRELTDGQDVHTWYGMCYAGGYIYACTTSSIHKYTSGLAYVSEWGAAGTGDGQFTSAEGIATDGTYLWITDVGGVGGSQRIQKFLLNGTFVAKYGTYGSGDAQFHNPRGIWASGTITSVSYIPYRAPILKAGLDGSYVDSYPVHRFRDQIQLMEDGVVAATKYIGLNAPGAITASYNITLPAAVPGAQAHFAISTAGVVTFGQNVGTTGSPTFVRITSLSVAIGTAPITVTSTTVCTNLNAGMVDGVHIATLSVGAIPYASSASNLAALAAVAAGSYLRSDGLTTAPLWSTLKLPNAATAFRLPVATSANTIGEVAAVGATGEYLAGATGAIPSWATLNQAAVAGLTTASSPAFVDLNVTGVYKVDGVQVLKEQQAAIADLNAAYVAGDLDTEAEIIVAFNATNAKINAILAMHRAHGIIAT